MEWTIYSQKINTTVVGIKVSRMMKEKRKGKYD